MRITRHHFGSVLSLVLGAVNLCSGQAQAQEDANLKPEDANVRFRWALGALSGTNTLVPLQDEAKVRSGDRIQVLVEPLKACWVYVIAEKADGQFAQWYPAEASGPDPAANRKTLNVELDKSPGKERLHVLGSAARLSTLEGLLIEYKRAPQDAKLRAAGRITAELKSLRDKALAKPSRTSEQVLFVKYRSGNPTIQTLAREVTAKDLVVKSVTLDHQ